MFVSRDCCVQDSRGASIFSQRRVPRFGDAHHKRVPTPMKKRRYPRHYEAPATPNSELEEEEKQPPTPAKPPGVPDPYYPIYLPIDQAFKAKYIFHQRRGKTFQERVYVFLEHPVGWVCFVYHFSVWVPSSFNDVV